MRFLVSAFFPGVVLSMCMASAVAAGNPTEEFPPVRGAIEEALRIFEHGDDGRSEFNRQSDPVQEQRIAAFEQALRKITVGRRYGVNVSFAERPMFEGILEALSNLGGREQVRDGDKGALARNPQIPELPYAHLRVAMAALIGGTAPANTEADALMDFDAANAKRLSLMAAALPLVDQMLVGHAMDVPAPTELYASYKERPRKSTARKARPARSWTARLWAPLRLLKWKGRRR